MYSYSVIADAYHVCPLQALAGGGANVHGAQTQGPAAAARSTPASFAVSVTYSLSYAQPTAGIQSHHSHFPSLAGAAASAGSAFGSFSLGIPSIACEL